MLKLKKNVLSLIEANVKPEFIDDQVEVIIENPPCPTGFSCWQLDGCRTRHGKPIQFTLTWDDFEEVEELKTGVWYPRGKWDGNPNGFMVVQALDKEKCKECGICPYDFGVHPVSLWGETTHFMYIEPFGEHK